jgi:NACHT domain
MRYRTRRDGVIALGLLLLPLALLWLLARSHQLDTATVAIVVAVSLGLPVLWMAWATYRGGPGSQPDELNLARIADRLAVVIRAQWESEAAIRRLNDPWPLPVSWIAPNPDSADSWDSLVRLASSGAGWPSPPAAKRWAAGPSDLAGRGNDLATVLAKVPTGRLLVLGEPGAGKTMLMVRLVLDQLSRRHDGEPVPVLVSAASWNPIGQDLRGWLAAQLISVDPGLAATATRGRSSLAERLIEAGLVMLIMDGIDEIPEMTRGSAISQINDALGPGMRAVVTCRSQEYQGGMQRSQHASGFRLRGAAAIELRPLDAVTVREYLSDDVGSPVTAARWDPIFKVLGTEAPAGQALTTPLMVGLARVIYNPRPGEGVGQLRDPAELCAPDIRNRRTVEQRLFDAYIPAAYRSCHATSHRQAAQQAERWLMFLAHNQPVSSDLRWWELSESVPDRVLGYAIGLAAAVVSGLAAGVTSGLITGIAVAALAGLGVGSAERLRRLALEDGYIREGCGHLMLFGLCGCFIVALAVGWLGAVMTGDFIGVALGLAITFIAALAAACLYLYMMFMLAAARLPRSRRRRYRIVGSSPRASLARDRRACVGLAFMAGLVTGSTSGLASALLTQATVGRGVGIAMGLAMLLTFKVFLTEWPSFVVARAWLAIHHRLPWRLMTFLGDAHRRGVLRQVGAAYQFRHIELQRRLVARSSGSTHEAEEHVHLASEADPMVGD